MLTKDFGIFFCASGENRTLTQLPERDFESRASTSSATEAIKKNVGNNNNYYSLHNYMLFIGNCQRYCFEL